MNPKKCDTIKRDPQAKDRKAGDGGAKQGLNNQRETQISQKEILAPPTINLQNMKADPDSPVLVNRGEKLKIQSSSPF